MNSKQFDMDEIVMGQIKENKSFKFVKLYKCAAEKKVVQCETSKGSKKAKKSMKNIKSESNTAKRSRSPNKIKKKSLDLSNIETVESNCSETPRTSGKNIPNNKDEAKLSEENGVKSIMKTKSSDIDPLLNVSNFSTPNSKPKKRNKSVSFMLEDTDEVVVKRSKSNDSNNERVSENGKLNNIKYSTKIYKRKKNLQSKENQNLNQRSTEIGNKENYTNVTESTLGIPVKKEVPSGMKKTVNKVKKSKLSSEKGVETIENDDDITEELSSENKLKNSKKKKRKTKSIPDSNVGAEGEPVSKTRKKDLKPEAIAKGLESLNIGDNAHTLTNLLDEMTVVDKNKNKKDRQKRKRDKEKSIIDTKDNPVVPSKQGNNAEEKEKVKWSNRKWNKDSKGDAKHHLHTSVVVENLPIKIMCGFKTLLSEYFSKFGTIAGIGVAEAYPTAELKPVFTTTVFFQEEEAATKALQEDNAAFEGSRLRVRRALPPADTTLVVRARALSEQALSSLFSSAGRVRNIRQLIKGKKAMGTAFVEFDGPEAVERALQLAEDATINGKKIYVSKFEIRSKGKSARSEQDAKVRRQ